jgi:hypothetical protein
MRRYYFATHHQVHDSEWAREQLVAALRADARRWRDRAASPRGQDRSNVAELLAMAEGALEFARDVERRLLVRLPEQTEDNDT